MHPRNLLPAALIGFALAMTSAGCATVASRNAEVAIDDVGLTAKVKARLVEDPAVKAMNIKVDTYKGVVQLTGFAASPAEAEKAAQLARTTAGVKSVTNDIRLASK